MKNRIVSGKPLAGSKKGWSRLAASLSTGIKHERPKRDQVGTRIGSGLYRRRRVGGYGWRFGLRHQPAKFQFLQSACAHAQTDGGAVRIQRTDFGICVPQAIATSVATIKHSKYNSRSFFLCAA